MRGGGGGGGGLEFYKTPIRNGGEGRGMFSQRVRKTRAKSACTPFYLNNRERRFVLYYNPRWTYEKKTKKHC